MLSHTQPTVILRHALSGEWLHFENPQQVISVSRPDEVLPALKEIEALVKRHGWYAAGFIGYEAAAAFDSAYATHPITTADGLPLLWFGLYPAPRRTVALPPASGSYQLMEWIPSVTREAYDTAIAHIRQQIAEGRTYQVNYTFRLISSFSGDPWMLFLDMFNAQPVGLPAFLDTGRYAICSTSPELFFRLDEHRVTCRPMKGTAARGRTLAEDEARAEWLRNSTKNRAENVMIVDMLRNDLGRVAQTGSVQVPELFNIERYQTLWQMTSTVSAEVRAPLAEILAALFPSASITGAPKVSTMKVIAALETTPRRIYTGAIGFLAPDRQAQFNVAIRTVLIDREKQQAEYGVGSGVVWDSTAGDEYSEALLKARILTEPGPAFSLLETLRWTPAEGYFLLERHLKRLCDSAAYFGYAYDETRVRASLAEAVEKMAPAAQRVRLLLDAQGSPACEAFPLTTNAAGKPVRVKLAVEPVRSEDVFLFHKTTRRAVYEQARQGRPDCDDVLLYNERGELTESTIANLVVELDSQLLTPPVSCGLLAGTLRAALLEQGAIQERILYREDLPRCTKIFLVNSVREWMEAELA